MAAFDELKNFPELEGSLDANVILGVQGPQGPIGPQGPAGDNYVLTDADKAEIAELAADLVEAPEHSGGNVDQVSIEPAEDDIPKIFFGGALQQTKDEKVVPFRYISKTDDFSGFAEIKAQGNSSMGYPKKNQTVKMFEDEVCETKMKKDFKGWGKQNKHCYKANWIDLSHARNVVSARIWGDVVKSRVDYESLPELLRTSPNQGAVDGFPVKVYADGVYQGRYTLNIPKDKWMTNMDDGLDTHCILCGEGYVSGCFREASVSQWTDEIHDSMPSAIKARWIEVINFVMNSSDEEFKTKLGMYFDVPSLIDYHIYGLISCGLDAYGKNQLYLTYDGQKWFASMYDMDSTWGLYWSGGKFVPTSYGRNEYEDMVQGRQGNLLYIRLEKLFSAELQTRWAELKNGALSIENIINRFERFTDIAPAELVKEDYASTTGEGKFTGIPSQTTNNIQQIRAFALARQAWTDAYVAGLTPEVEVPCTGISLSATELTFTSEGSQTLTATVTPDGCTDPVTWESDNTSVATVSGGVVTAIANGSAVITAKCGEYIANCSVSVSGISEAVPCTGITLDKTELTIESDGTQTLTATVVPSNTTDKIIWVSSAPAVASVENGVVTANGSGNAIITATCGNQSATCTVTVEDTGIDYTANALDGATWVQGKIDKNTGVRVDGTKEVVTENPVALQSGVLYSVTNNSKATWPGFAWIKEDGTCITYDETSAAYHKTFCVADGIKLMAKAYVDGIEGVDMTKLVVKPEDNRNTAETYMKINFAELEWVVGGTYRVECILPLSALPVVDRAILHNVDLFTFGFTTAVVKGNYTNRIVTVMHQWNNNIYLSVLGGADIDAFNAYVAEKQPYIEINPHLKPTE